MNRYCFCCGEQARSCICTKDEVQYFAVECDECNAHYCITKEGYDHLFFPGKKTSEFKRFYLNKYKPKSGRMPYGKTIPIIGLDIPYP